MSVPPRFPADENRVVAFVRAFVLLTRPHFLVGGAVMYAIGAFSGDVTNPGAYLLGQGMVTSAQVTAHYVNEYADVGPDRLVTNRTMFSGGSGVLSSGRLAPVVALRAAVVSSGLAVLLAAFVAAATPVASLLGLLALVVSWSYSFPPVRLLETGWGEMVTSVVVAGMVPAVGALVNGGSIKPGLAWAMAVLVPVHLAMMLAFELPDLDSDRLAGKTVLAVRIGYRASVTMLGALLVGAAIVGGVGAWATDKGVAWLLAGVTAAWVTVSAARRDRYQLLTLSAVVTLLAAAVGLLVSFRA